MNISVVKMSSSKTTYCTFNILTGWTKTLKWLLGTPHLHQGGPTKYQKHLSLGYKLLLAYILASRMTRKFNQQHTKTI